MGKKVAAVYRCAVDGWERFDAELHENRKKWRKKGRKIRDDLSLFASMNSRNGGLFLTPLLLSLSSFFPSCPLPFPLSPHPSSPFRVALLFPHFILHSSSLFLRSSLLPVRPFCFSLHPLFFSLRLLFRYTLFLLAFASSLPSFPTYIHCLLSSPSFLSFIPLFTYLFPSLHPSCLSSVPCFFFSFLQIFPPALLLFSLSSPHPTTLSPHPPLFTPIPSLRLTPLTSHTSVFFLPSNLSFASSLVHTSFLSSSPHISFLPPFPLFPFTHSLPSPYPSYLSPLLSFLFSF